MNIGALVQSLRDVSEKSARIARAIRSEKELFELLVEEKTGIEKNDRFVRDFKTLADVLVQETVRHDLEEQFPGIAGQLQGEESNEFQNAAGESVKIKLQNSQEETSQLLVKVLGGNQVAASLLAQLVHSKKTREIPKALANLEATISTSRVGIWIDPIDSTAQYIKGQGSNPDENGLHSQGLPCVTVLIGVFDLLTGMPIAGVINQPFAKRDLKTKKWKGRCTWGICHEGIKINNVKNPGEESPSDVEEDDDLLSVVVSSSEDAVIQDKLAEDFHLSYASGAGYKILAVIEQTTDVYVLAQATTYKWDTCAPHAILLSMGGGIINYKMALAMLDPDSDDEALAPKIKSCNLGYNKPLQDNPHKWQNEQGLIAFRDTSSLKQILQTLKSQS